MDFGISFVISPLFIYFEIRILHQKEQFILHVLCDLINDLTYDAYD